MRRGSRPNVLPAKSFFQQTIGQIAEQRGEVNRKGSNVKRKMIRDLCDYCLEYVYMYRNQIGLRVRGKKFACKECYAKKPEPKQDRAIPCWKHIIQMKKE